MRRTDPLIVGGGPAGAAAAITFARADAQHLLLERSRETGDAICGGFLSWRSLETLAGLGIDADALNCERITQVRILTATRTIAAPLPHPGLAVSRRRLDTVLLDHAARLGARIERGVAVRAIDSTVRLDDGSDLAADAVLLASGKHDIRGEARPADARGADPTLGLRIRLAPHPTLDRLVGDAVELHLVDRGYVGVARQEDGSVNACMAVHRSRLHESGDPTALLAQLGREYPALGERLAHAVVSGPDAIANVPYGWRATATRPGLYRLGDQAAVIPSLAGEGMGIALASGIAAARACLDRMAAPAWQHAFAARTRRPVALADAIRRVAERPGVIAGVLPLLGAAPFLIHVMARLTRIDDRSP